MIHGKEKTVMNIEAVGTYQTVEPLLDMLKPSPENRRIYGGGALPEAFVESVRRNGILVPLAIKRDGTIISGHRRWQAARTLGMEMVPAHVISFDNELDEREAVIDFNRQREKTFSQKMREADELREIERERAQAKMLSGRRDPEETLPQGESERAPQTRDKVAEKAGIGSGRTYDKAARVWEAAKSGDETAKEYVEKIDQGKMTVNKAHVELRRQQVRKRREKTPPPEGKYRIIYADPPWRYGDKRDGRTTGAEDHYPSMSIKEMCELPVAEIAEDDAVLFLWVTSPLLKECFRVIKAWGFEYKTSFVWYKVKHNMGHYNSVRHEFLLICTKGSCRPDNRQLYDSVQSIERTEHSRKPEEFRAIIDELYTYGNRIELFARDRADGWQVWGNEPNLPPPAVSSPQAASSLGGE